MLNLKYSRIVKYKKCIFTLDINSMNKRLAIIFLLAISFSACKEETPEPASKEEPTPTDTLSFDGRWVGTYDGDDQGNIDITVAEDGKLSGKGLSSLTSTAFTITGEVSSKGEIVNAATEIGAIFSGTLLDKTGTGTWVNLQSSVMGSWMVTKQE